MTVAELRGGLTRTADLIRATLSLWQPRSAPPSHADLCAALAHIAVAINHSAKELSSLVAVARAEGVMAERQRVASIMNHRHAQGRLAFAWALASSGAVTLEQAEQYLGADALNSAFAEADEAQPISIN